MKITRYDLSFRSLEVIQEDYRAFEHIQNLVIFLQEKGFSSKVSQDIAVNILYTIAIEGRNIYDYEAKFRIFGTLFYARFRIENYLYKEKCGIIKIEMIVLEVERKKYKINKAGIKNNFLNMIMDKELELNFKRVEYDYKTRMEYYTEFEKEKKHKERVGVEITSEKDENRIFIIKTSGKYILTGLGALFNIEVTFDKRSFKNKHFSTKKAVRDTLKQHLMSIQGLMYPEDWVKIRKIKFGN